MRFRPEIAQAIVDISNGHPPGYTQMLEKARWAILSVAFGLALRQFCIVHGLVSNEQLRETRSPNDQT